VIGANEAEKRATGDDGVGEDHLAVVAPVDLRKVAVGGSPEG
jgi:hypothetical protein